LGIRFQAPTDRLFFIIVRIHSCCFHQLCNKSLLSCPATEAIGELLVRLLSRGFPPLDPPHKTRSGALIGCGVIAGMVPGPRACNRHCPPKPLPPVLSSNQTDLSQPELCSESERFKGRVGANQRGFRDRDTGTGFKARSRAEAGAKDTESAVSVAINPVRSDNT
jgi:hypothetical protein